MATAIEVVESLDAPAPVVVPVVAPVAPVVDSPAVTQRKDELATARRVILTAMAGKKSGGGSDLVGRAFRALAALAGTSGKLGNKRNGFAAPVARELTSLDDVVDACQKLDKVKVIEWATAYVAGLKDNKTNQSRLAAFTQYVNDDRFASIALAIKVLINYSAFNFTEKYTDASGNTLKYTVDLRREVNDMFGLKLTQNRRAKNATIVD